MLHVIATVTAIPGKRDALLAAFHEVVPQVRAESGCLEYEVAIDVPTEIEVQEPVSDDRITVVEKWQDLAALQAHLSVSHMMEFRRRVLPWVQSVSLRVLEPR